MSHLIFCFKTNRPGAWRIDGWGLRRRTHNGEYQVPHNAAPDISSSMMKGFFPKRPSAGRKRDRPERPGGSAALGVFEARFRKGEHTTENISWRIMRQLIFRSVSDCSGQGKTRSHFRRGFYFARLRALGRWGRRHVCRPERRSRRKNISCRIMRQLIFRTIVGGGTALRNH